jgi:hypothetical protein
MAAREPSGQRLSSRRTRPLSRPLSRPMPCGVPRNARVVPGEGLRRRQCRPRRLTGHGASPAPSLPFGRALAPPLAKPLARAEGASRPVRAGQPRCEGGMPCPDTPYEEGGNGVRGWGARLSLRGRAHSGHVPARSIHSTGMRIAGRFRFAQGPFGRARIGRSWGGRHSGKNGGRLSRCVYGDGSGESERIDGKVLADRCHCPGPRVY